MFWVAEGYQMIQFITFIGYLLISANKNPFKMMRKYFMYLIQIYI